MSGVGREVGELEELLMSMRGARDDLSQNRNAEKNAWKERDAEEERIGDDLMKSVINRCGHKERTDDEESISLRASKKFKIYRTGTERV